MKTFYVLLAGINIQKLGEFYSHLEAWAFAQNKYPGEIIVYSEIQLEILNESITKILKK